MDGTRNFSNLSDAELARAKTLVDAALTPVDHENLRFELRRRRKLRAAARRPIVLKIFGGVLVLGAIVGASGLRVVVLQPPRLLMPVMLAPLALWAVAGVCLIRGKAIGVPLGIAALCLQLVSFAIGDIAYAFSPLAGAQLGWSAGNITVSFSAGPIGYVRTGQAESMQIAIDLVALIGIHYLLRSGRRGSI